MRAPSWVAALVSVAILTAPQLARADLTLAASVGSGLQVAPDKRIPTNIMVAPGAELLGPLVRAEVGIVADMGDVGGRDFDLQVRPMLLFDPPLIPLYGRLTVGIANLTTGPLAVAFGGSLGAELSLSALSLFGEVGFIPQASGDGFDSIFEGRAGVGFVF